MEDLILPTQTIFHVMIELLTFIQEPFLYPCWLPLPVVFQFILSLSTYCPRLSVSYPYGLARLTRGCGLVCFPKNASWLVFTGTYQHGEIHIFGF